MGKNNTLTMSDKKILHIGNLDKIYEKFNLIVPKNAKRIIEIFKNNKYKILISGGFVRDVLLNELPKDIDFVTNLTYDKVKTLLEKNLTNIKKIEAQGQTFQVVRIVFENNEEYEIATFRMDGEYKDGVHPERVTPITSPGLDAMRRDFTINALFYNPLSGNIIDYVNGLSDIAKKELRFIGNAEERIKEDKSRMLRYIRFILKTNFNINDSDKNSIKRHAAEINSIPKELLKKELDKIIKLDNGNRVIELLDELNLLENIFPDIKSLETCEGGAPYHMEGNVLIHTKMTCKNLPENADSILKWAAIFHDIGKPETRKSELINNEEKISFIGHEKIGATKTISALKKIKFSNSEMVDISWLVENHLQIFIQIFSILKNNPDQIAKEKCTKILKKLIKSSSQIQVERLLILAKADGLASVYKDEDDRKQYGDQIFEFFELAKKEIQKEQEIGINLNKIIDGKTIMQFLNLKPGKEIGEIKNQIMEILSDKNFDTVEEVNQKFLEILENYKKSK